MNGKKPTPLDPPLIKGEDHQKHGQQLIQLQRYRLQSLKLPPLTRGGLGRGAEVECLRMSD